MKVAVEKIISVLPEALPQSKRLDAGQRRALALRLDRLDGKQDGFIQDADPRRVLASLTSYASEVDSPLTKLFSDPKEHLRIQGRIRAELNGCLQEAQGFRLRIRAFRTADDDGSRQAQVTLETAKQYFLSANEIFKNSDTAIEIVFDPESDWEEIRDSELNGLSSISWRGKDKAGRIAAKYPEDAVVFFIRGSDDDPWGGFAEFLTNDRNAFIALRAPTGAEAFAHELGHYLGLPHTFPGLWIYDGSNNVYQMAKYYLETHGHLDGDGFDDTPWDAGTGLYHEKGWNPCDPEHGSYVIADHTIAPDRSNIMSYFYCGMPTVSPQQRQRMYQVLREFKNGSEQTVTVNQCLSPRYVEGHLSALKLERNREDRFKALDGIIAYLEDLEVFEQDRASEELSSLVDRVADMIDEDPGLGFHVALYLGERADPSPSPAYRFLTRILNWTDAMSPALLPSLEKAYDRTDSDREREDIADLWSDTRAEKVKGYHLGLSPAFAKGFISTGTGDYEFFRRGTRDRIDPAVAGTLPEDEIYKEEITEASEETGWGFQLQGTYRGEDGVWEALGQLNMQEYQDPARPEARPRTQLDAMIGAHYFFFSQSKRAFEVYSGWQLGALYSFRDQTVGFSLTPILPGFGLRAPLSEDLYFDVFAVPLLDGFTPQNGHRGRTAFRLKGTAGLLYHYND